MGEISVNEDYLHSLKYEVNGGLVSFYLARDKKKRRPMWSASGAEGARTPDLLTASQVLSQLSYCPKASRTVRAQAQSVKTLFIMRISLHEAQP